jgi:hypothetical protein
MVYLCTWRLDSKASQDYITCFLNHYNKFSVRKNFGMPLKLSLSYVRKVFKRGLVLKRAVTPCAFCALSYLAAAINVKLCPSPAIFNVEW